MSLHKQAASPTFVASKDCQANSPCISLIVTKVFYIRGTSNLKKQLMMNPFHYTFLPLLLCLLAGTRDAQAQCSANAVATQVTCFGLNNGSIDLSASNGTAPYTYLWSNNQTDEDLSGLAAGTYTCTVTDALACTATVTAIIGEPALLSAVAIGGTLNCVINSLIVTVNANGGTQPYAYLWSNGATTENPSISVPGTYTVTVTDALGCTAIAQTGVTMDTGLPFVCIAPPGGLDCVVTSLTLDATCSPTGPGITYIWVGPGIISGWTTPTPVVNQPGVYTLTVTDNNNGCTSLASVVVTQNHVLPTASAGPDRVLNCVSLAVQCNGSGSSTGAVFSYQWSTVNGNIIAGQNTLFPTVNQPGTYNLLVTNTQNGCTATDQMIVTGDITPPIADAGPDTGIPCGGGTTFLDASGSAGAQFTYLWAGPGINVANQSAMNPIISLPGVYFLIVTNTANGCTATDQVRVFSGPAIPEQDIVVNNVSCQGGDGAINLTFNNGAPPYTYLWSNGATTEDLSNLNAGTYSVTLTDATACSHYAVLGIIQTTPIAANTSQISSTNCASANGSINLFVTGGSTPYTYLWSNGATTQDLTNMLSGIYTVTVTDALSCNMAQTVALYANLGLNGSLVPPACFGGSNGSINLSLTGGVAPFTFQWFGPNGYSSTQEDLSNIISGTYTVSVTDMNGCIGTSAFVLTQPGLVLLNAIVDWVTCFGSNDGSAIAQITGGQAPYEYLWSNAQTTQTITGLVAGTYTVTVTDANGCTFLDNDALVGQPDELILTFQTLSNDCDGAVIAAIVSGGTPQYDFSWTNGSQDSVVQITTTGTYSLMVSDDNGCSVSSDYDIQINNGLCGLLEGRVYQDLVENCQEDGEPGLSGWIMQAQGSNGTFYGVTNANGNFNIGVLPGDYTIAISPPNPIWKPCWLSIPSGSVAVNDTLGGFDFPVKKDMICPALSVDIISSNLRRCFSNNFYSVQYCNHGTEAATDAFIILSLDPLISPFGSSLPYTDLGNGTLRFEVGDLDLGECGSFVLYVKVSCDAVLGQTHCTEAHIYPDSSCILPNVQWSGASLRISSECQTDSIRFSIENIGVGNMPNALDYIIIEDQVMMMSAPVQLNAGESVTVSVPANGSTWRLEMEQLPFHPGHSAPAVSVEGCTNGSTFSTGFVTQFSADDADEFVDIDCKENTGSYDPNDKQAFPKGYGTAHYIRPGTPLEYQIRFQNTGNDTAFTVRLVDTLSAWLDPTTLRPGASSHAYTWDLNGAGVLTFLYENILLPDSIVDEPGSHGFVKFTINHQADAPLETVIENTAEIYFDFNEAIVTNTTFHRLGENFVTVGLWQPEQPRYAVSVSPNPFSDAAILEVKGLYKNSPLHLQVFDLQGKLQLEMDSDGTIFQLKKGGLPTGIYLFKIDQKGKSVGAGKLIIQDQ